MTVLQARDFGMERAAKQWRLSCRAQNNYDFKKQNVLLFTFEFGRKMSLGPGLNVL